jgi:hypothetical protein
MRVCVPRNVPILTTHLEAMQVVGAVQCGRDTPEPFSQCEVRNAAPAVPEVSVRCVAECHGRKPRKHVPIQPKKGTGNRAMALTCRQRLVRLSAQVVLEGGATPAPPCPAFGAHRRRRSPPPPPRAHAAASARCRVSNRCVQEYISMYCTAPRRNGLRAMQPTCCNRQRRTATYGRSGCRALCDGELLDGHARREVGLALCHVSSRGYARDTLGVLYIYRFALPRRIARGLFKAKAEAARRPA